MAGYNFACKDLGMECKFEIHGATSKDETLQLASTHARIAHKITSMPPELAAKVGTAIKG